MVEKLGYVRAGHLFTLGCILRLGFKNSLKYLIASRGDFVSRYVRKPVKSSALQFFVILTFQSSWIKS